MVKRLWGYLIVGAIAFLIDIALTIYLARFFHYVIANTLGFVVANLANFLLAHKWVFNHDFSRPQLARAYPPVFAVSIIGLLLSDLFIYIFIDMLGLDLIPGKVATTALVLIWNFYGRIIFVYKHPSPR